MTCLAIGPACKPEADPYMFSTFDCFNEVHVPKSNEVNRPCNYQNLAGAKSSSLSRLRLLIHATSAKNVWSRRHPSKKDIGRQ